MKNLKGVIPALLTPFHENGTVNEDSLRKIVDYNLKKGVTGFYVCGSTSEVFLLKPEERKKIVEIVTSEVKGKAAVICHVGNINTDWSIELAKHAALNGADALSSVTPFYYSFSYDELYGYYKELAESQDLPFIIYNIPGRSGVNISTENLIKFREIKNIAGLKHTSFDLFQLNCIKKALPDLIIYNGFDEVFLAGLSMGADGGIGSTYNYMAEKFVTIMKLVSKGKIEIARTIQTDICDVVYTMRNMPGLNVARYFLDRQGIPFGKSRKPFRPLTKAERKILDAVYERYLDKGN